MKMKSRDQKDEKATEARRQITTGVPKSLARMRVFLFFSEEGRNVCFSLEGTLIFQPLPPYSMLKTSRRFFQSGKISGVLKIDAYMVRRSKIWSLHRSMHPFTSTLNRGEGLLKIVTFPARKRVFRLLT